MALRLKGISKTPFWLLIFTVQVIPMAGIVAMIMLVKSNDTSPTTTTDNTVYYLIGALGAVAMAVTIMCHCVVSLRIGTLASMLQQDPQVIVGDPQCLLKLSRTPWYGVSEVDLLQLAILQTYNSYAINNTPSAHPSGIGGARYESDVDKLEWKTAVSESSIDEAPFDPLESYLASQQQRRSSSNEQNRPVVGSAPTAHDEATGQPLLQRSNSMTSASSRVSRVGSAFKRFFTPRSHKSPMFPVVAAGQTGGVSADGDDDVNSGRIGSVDSSDFYSFPASADEKSLLFNKMNNKDNNRSGAVEPYGATGVSSVTRGGGVGIQTSSETFVNMDTRRSISGFEPWDPCGDNLHPEWSLLSKGLKLQSSIFVQLLSSIRVGQSLSSVTLPVHILESRSLLEMLSDMFVNWELLMPIAMGKISSPEDRVIQVFKWFISAFHLKPRGAKKPYNSILGEVFQCKFPSFSKNLAQIYPARKSGDERSLVYLAEQVSHHPPVTAFCAEYANLLSVRGVYMPKGKMVSLNCAASIGEGSFVVSFPTTGCKYRVTFPTAYVSGIVAGTPQLELGGTVTISDLGGSTCCATVEFLRKGWISGSFDQVHCKVMRGNADSSDPDNIIQEFVGTWHDKIYYKVAGSPSDKKKGKGPIFFDPAAYESEVGKTHRPIAVDCAGHLKQSRAVWKELTPALRAGNADAATAAKTKVEVAQRLERKLSAQENRDHETAFFKFNCGRNVKEASDEERCDEENWDFVGQDQLAQY